MVRVQIFTVSQRDSAKFFVSRFLAAYAVSKSVLVLHEKLKPKLSKRKGIDPANVQRETANRQRSFSGRGNVCKQTALFRAHCQKLPKVHYFPAKIEFERFSSSRRFTVGTPYPATNIHGTNAKKTTAFKL